MENSNNQKTKTIAPVYRNVLLTEDVLRGLAVIHTSPADFLLTGNKVCDAALIHDAQAGLAVYNGSNCLSYLSFTVEGKASILMLKQLIKATVTLAEKISFAPDNSIIGKSGIENDFCSIWENAPVFNRDFLKNIFMVSMAFLPLKSPSPAPCNIMELSRQAELLKALFLISTGIQKGISKQNFINASEIFDVLNNKFATQLFELSVVLEGRYEVTTSKGTTVADLDFVNSSTTSIFGDYVFGFKPNPNMNTILFYPKDIISIIPC